MLHVCSTQAKTPPDQVMFRLVKTGFSVVCQRGVELLDASGGSHPDVHPLPNLGAEPVFGDLQVTGSEVGEHGVRGPGCTRGCVSAPATVRTPALKPAPIAEGIPDDPTPLDIVTVRSGSLGVALGIGLAMCHVIARD